MDAPRLLSAAMILSWHYSNRGMDWPHWKSELFRIRGSVEQRAFGIRRGAEVVAAVRAQAVFLSPAPPAARKTPKAPGGEDGKQQRQEPVRHAEGSHRLNECHAGG